MTLLCIRPQVFFQYLPGVSQPCNMILITYTIHDTGRECIDVIGPFLRAVEQSHFLNLYQILCKQSINVPLTAPGAF